MTLDPFAADILNRCRIAEASYGGHPNPAWSTGEKLAVALQRARADAALHDIRRRPRPAGATRRHADQVGV